MNVAEFIKILQTFPQDLPVAYRLHSEQCLLESDQIEAERACLPRPDGWIEDYRKDRPSQEYLMLPGN